MGLASQRVHSSIWLLLRTRCLCTKLQHLEKAKEKMWDTLYLPHRLCSDKQQSDHFCIKHPSITFTVLLTKITKWKHTNKLTKKKYISVVCEVKSMLSQCFWGVRKKRTLTSTICCWSLLFSYIIVFFSLGFSWKQTATLPRLPPQEPNSPFL